MDVCIITTVHPPSDPRLFYKQARSLCKQHNVTIIAPGKENSHKNINGIEIITVRVSRFKLLHPVTIVKVFIAGLRKYCDVIHCLEPGSLLIAVIFKAFMKKKVVYDGHEYISSLIAENSFFPNFARPLVRKFVAWGDLFLAGFADAIITVDETLYHEYRKCNNNVSILPNYPSLELIDEIEQAQEHYPLIYVGGISRERGIYQMLNVSQRTGIRLLCVGPFTNEKNRKEIKQYTHINNISTVKFTGILSYDDAIAHIKSASVGFSLLQDLPRYNDVVPSKVYDYLACGKPAIVSDIPVLREQFGESECCIFVDPKDEDSIFNAVREIFNLSEMEKKAMGKQGRKLIESNYNWKNNKLQLLQIYKEIPL